LLTSWSNYAGLAILAWLSRGTVTAWKHAHAHEYSTAAVAAYVIHALQSCAATSVLSKHDKSLPCVSIQHNLEQLESFATIKLLCVTCTADLCNSHFYKFDSYNHQLR
jgi:hypothetical protein